MPSRSLILLKTFFKLQNQFNQSLGFLPELLDFDPIFGYVGKRLISFQINKK